MEATTGNSLMMKNGVLMEMDGLETAVMRTHLALQQFIKENKRKRDFDADELPVGGVMSLSYSLLPEVRRQLQVVRDWLTEREMDGTDTDRIKMEMGENPAVEDEGFEYEGQEDYTAPPFITPDTEEDEGSVEDIIYGDQEDYEVEVPQEETDNPEAEGSTEIIIIPKGRERRRIQCRNENNQSSSDPPIASGSASMKFTSQQRQQEYSSLVSALSNRSHSLPPGPYKRGHSVSVPTCPKCFKTFKHRSEKTRHLQRPPCGDPQNIRHHICPHCIKPFSTDFVLKRHMGRCPSKPLNTT